MERLREGKHQKERLGKVKKLHVAERQDAFFKLDGFVFQNEDFELFFIYFFIILFARSRGVWWSRQHRQDMAFQKV